MAPRKSGVQQATRKAPGPLSRGLRSLGWLLGWALLILLPFMAPSIIDGVAEAIFYAERHRQEYQLALQHFHSQTLNGIAEPPVNTEASEDEPSDQPTILNKLRNPRGWWEQVGMTRFDFKPNDQTQPINMFAELSELYRKTQNFGLGVSHWHHWIYLSPTSNDFEDDSWSANDWDQAFSELIQFHDANPAAHDAGFHYTSCPGNFLCDIWRTRGPALLHLTTEVPVGGKKGRNLRAWDPVTARLIEFPQTKTQPIPPAVFPSNFEQLRSLTANETAWEEYPPYSEVKQWAYRLSDLIEEKKRQFPGSYGQVLQVEEKIRDTSIVSSVFFRSVHTMALLTTVVVEIAVDALMTQIGLRESTAAEGQGMADNRVPWVRTEKVIRL